MNKKLFNVLLFTAGAAIGSLVTWKVVKAKYEQILQEEIDSFKETYALCMSESSGKYTPSAEEDEPVQDDIDDEDDEFDESEITNYHMLANRYNTSGKNAENVEEGEGDEEVPYVNGPCVISPEQYGDGNYDHELWCLTYYADGVLANDWWEEYDIDETIGQESLKHFGDYAQGILHVRNERLKADYEIVQDPRAYSEVTVGDPHMHGHAR